MAPRYLDFGDKEELSPAEQERVNAEVELAVNYEQKHQYSGDCGVGQLVKCALIRSYRAQPSALA